MWKYQNNDELYHYGVRGMKWGVIKKPEEGSYLQKLRNIYNDVSNSPIGMPSSSQTVNSKSNASPAKPGGGGGGGSSSGINKKLVEMMKKAKAAADSEKKTKGSSGGGGKSKGKGGGKSKNKGKGKSKKKSKSKSKAKKKSKAERKKEMTSSKAREDTVKIGEKTMLQWNEYTNSYDAVTTTTTNINGQVSQTVSAKPADQAARGSAIVSNLIKQLRK